MSWEQLAKVGELCSVQAERVEDLKAEEHRYARSESHVVRRWNKTGDNGRFTGECDHAAEDSECHVFWSREAVDEEHGDSVETHGECEPGRRIDDLLDGAIAEGLVKNGAIVVNDKHTTALDNSTCTDSEEGPLAVRWLLEDVDPGGVKCTIDENLFLDLVEFSASISVFGICRIRVESVENDLGLLMSSLHNQPDGQG